MIPLILASGSPRRRELLQRLGVGFRVIPSPIDERSLEFTGDPGQQAQAMASAKAQGVAALVNGTETSIWVLGADTMVCVDGQILGKPQSAQAAVAMLRLLQGRQHQVFTGLCLQQVSGQRPDQGRELTPPILAYEQTRVWMAPLKQSQIQAYVATGEPMDKAGAYGIQGYGSCLIQRIEGCYFNVVGLPLHRTAALLQAAGIALWEEGRP